MRFLWYPEQCGVPENIRTLPRPNKRRATKILRKGREGGPKGDNFRGGGSGVASRVFLGGGGGRGLRVRLMSKQTVILLLIGVPKQTLIFSSMMFYWRSAECFFYGLHDGLCNPIVVGLWLNFQLSVALLHNILWYSMQCVYVLISLLLTRFSLKGSN